MKGCGSDIYFVNRGVVEHMLKRLDFPSHKCSSYITGYFPFRCMGNRVPLLEETECFVKKITTVDESTKQRIDQFQFKKKNGRSLAWACQKAVSVPSRSACVCQGWPVGLHAHMPLVIIIMNTTMPQNRSGRSLQYCRYPTLGLPESLYSKIGRRRTRGRRTSGLK